MKYFIALFAIVSFTVAQNDSPAIQLATVERSFSAASEKVGVKESFLQFFADNCVMFNPNPINGKELYKNGPPSTTHLTWYPTFVEVASSGDLGISTGPWEIRKTKKDTPVAYGHYFSIWGKQSDGKWKVIFDNGVRYPKENKRTEIEYIADLKSSNDVHRTKDDFKKELLESENKFIRSVKQEGIVKAYSLFGSSNVRIFRSDNFPSQNKKEGLVLVKKDKVQSKFYPLATQIAPTGDLGFTYGISVDAKNDSTSYIRVWRNELEWKIAVDMIEVFPK